MKPKVLAWCDFLVPTGFGNVAANLLDDLHKDYDLQVVGINYRGKKRYDTSKYFVYPTPRYEDHLGIDLLKNLAMDEQPDIIFLFQDIFHISNVIKDLKDASPKSKIVSYFPVDGGPLSVNWAETIHTSDEILVYTEWAKKVIRDTFPTHKQFTTLYHGVDKETFYPMDIEDIEKYRADRGWKGKFVVSNVNRFQPRKAITLTGRAFSMFAKGHKYCNECGWHMPISAPRCELCRKEDLKVKPKSRDDVMLYLHMMPQDSSMGPGPGNSLQNHMVNSGFTNADMNKILSINGRNIYKGEVPIEKVNEIYNGSNVNISTTLGEGCGLSLIESAATGTPSIAPYNSAIPEMLGNTGWMCSNKAIMTQSGDNGFFRPIVDEWQVVKALEAAYKQWKDRGVEVTLDQDCIDRIDDKFRWDDKRDTLRKVFQRVLSTKQ